MKVNELHNALINIRSIVLAPYSDDAKVRDVMHVLADEGYVSVETFRKKNAEVEARLEMDKGAGK